MDISAIRDQIDQIDKEIAHLFCQRMYCSAAIGAYKSEHGLPVYVPQRETEILERLSKDVDPDLQKYVEMLYRHIFLLSREYQAAEAERDG